MPEPELRFDSIPVDETYFTSEGYFIDHPIVTSTGIFEYKNRDGSIRRELRLPEEVFDPASLESYEGKPVIVTHAAGYVSKENVEQEYIGTVSMSGQRSSSTTPVRWTAACGSCPSATRPKRTRPRENGRGSRTMQSNATSESIILHLWQTPGRVIPPG